MMAAFDPRQPLVIVRAHIWGPPNDAVVRLALDTGATSTLINETVIRYIGYDPSRGVRNVWITTGSGLESATVLRVSKIAALGRRCRGFSLICYSLPSTTAVDGLLGLDFFRNRHLSIDFRSGRIRLR